MICISSLLLTVLPTAVSFGVVSPHTKSRSLRSLRTPLAAVHNEIITDEPTQQEATRLKTELLELADRTQRGFQASSRVRGGASIQATFSPIPSTMRT